MRRNELDVQKRRGWKRTPFKRPAGLVADGHGPIPSPKWELSGQSNSITLNPRLPAVLVLQHNRILYLKLITTEGEVQKISMCTFLPQILSHALRRQVEKVIQSQTAQIPSLKEAWICEDHVGETHYVVSTVIAYLFSSQSRLLYTANTAIFFPLFL